MIMTSVVIRFVAVFSSITTTLFALFLFLSAIHHLIESINQFLWNRDEANKVLGIRRAGRWLVDRRDWWENKEHRKFSEKVGKELMRSVSSITVRDINKVRRNLYKESDCDKQI